MPCWEINLVDVAFQAKSIPLLKKALETLGWKHIIDEDSLLVYTQGFVIDLNHSQATIDVGQQASLNKLKVAYSTEVVKAMAAKRRWVLKQRATQQFQARRY